MSSLFRVKLELIRDMESILRIKFQGYSECEADLFIEEHYMAYKSDKEYVFRDMYEFIEDGW